MDLREIGCGVNANRSGSCPIRETDIRGDEALVCSLVRYINANICMTWNILL
jgi:hypothetical protein